MQIHKLDQAGDRGWYIGPFDRALVKTEAAEVCHRVDAQGVSPAHYHSRCSETILFISGQAVVNDSPVSAGDVVVFQPGEVNRTVYLTDCSVVTVKIPAGGDDKVLV